MVPTHRPRKNKTFHELCEHVTGAQMSRPGRLPNASTVTWVPCSQKPPTLALSPTVPFPTPLQLQTDTCTCFLPSSSALSSHTPVLPSAARQASKQPWGVMYLCKKATFQMSQAMVITISFYKTVIKYTLIFFRFNSLKSHIKSTNLKKVNKFYMSLKIKTQQ